MFAFPPRINEVWEIINIFNISTPENTRTDNIATDIAMKRGMTENATINDSQKFIKDPLPKQY